MPVGLNLLIYGDVFHWGQLMAASVITTIPVVVLYVFIHRFMVEGLAAGAVKGRDPRGSTSAIARAGLERNRRPASDALTPDWADPILLGTTGAAWRER